MSIFNSKAAHPERILIIDDLILNRRTLCTILKRESYVLDMAEGGLEGLRKAQAWLPHLILLDVRMPDMDGYTVCARLKEEARTAEIPVVFISASGGPEDVLQAFRSGGADYISKPFTIEEVRSRVRTQLDLAAQRRAEQQYKRSMEEMQMAFVHDVTHDLKTPLAAVDGYAQLIQEALGAEGGADADTIRFYTERLLQNAGRMSRLVSDILALAQMETTFAFKFRRMRAADLLDLWAQRGHILSDYQGRSRIQVADTAVSSAVWIRIDEEKVMRVLENLLSNALKYSPRDRPITLSYTADEENVSLHITDGGPGIPAEYVPQLFDPFFRIEDGRHQAVEGSGLGLAIARTIARRHGGDVVLTHTSPQGSTFTLVLPRLPAVLNDAFPSPPYDDRGGDGSRPWLN